MNLFPERRIGLYLVAPLDVRIQNVIKDRGLSEKRAREHIAQVEKEHRKQRKRLRRALCRWTIPQPNLYVRAGHDIGRLPLAFIIPNAVAVEIENGVRAGYKVAVPTWATIIPLRDDIVPLGQYSSMLAKPPSSSWPSNKTSRMFASTNGADVARPLRLTSSAVPMGGEAHECWHPLPPRVASQLSACDGRVGNFGCAIGLPVSYTPFRPLQAHRHLRQPPGFPSLCDDLVFSPDGITLST